MLVKLISY